jgi:hypothetical protein
VRTKFPLRPADRCRPESRGCHRTRVSVLSSPYIERAQCWSRTASSCSIRDCPTSYGTDITNSAGPLRTGASRVRLGGPQIAYLLSFGRAIDPIRPRLSPWLVGRGRASSAREIEALRNETGGAQKPDVILLLPEKRTMIVDSKVSLASYDRLISAREEAERVQHATQFVRDVKTHIDDLSGKRYQDNEQIAAHDCVLMFVPIEGALAAALTAEPELFTYAWDKRVVIVGPPTLLMTLRTVASIWRYELQAENAQEIAKLAGVLCDKVSASLSDLNAVADRMNDALASHNDAVKRLATGRGNVLKIGERIRSLGVKSKNPMPAILVDGERVTTELELGEEDEVVDGPPSTEDQDHDAAPTSLTAT